jgi:hypothetical protein
MVLTINITGVEEENNAKIMTEGNQVDVEIYVRTNRITLMVIK